MAVTILKGVTSPNVNEVHVNQPLSDASAMFLQDPEMFTANRAIPMYSSSKQTNLYNIYDKEYWRRVVVAQRQEGTSVEAAEYKVSNTPYACIQYAVAAQITDEQKQNEDEWMNAEDDAAMFIGEQLGINEEKIMWNAIEGNKANFNTGTVSTTWNQAAATPLEDVEAGKLVIKRRTGKKMNKMLMGAEVASKLINSMQLRDLISGGATTAMPALIQEEFLSRAFGVQVFIMGASENTTIEGATVADADDVFINDKDVFGYYAPDSISLRTPTAIAKFDWNLFGSGSRVSVRETYDEDKMTTKLTGISAFDYKVLSNELGVYWTNAVA